MMSSAAIPAQRDDVVPVPAGGAEAAQTAEAGEAVSATETGAAEPEASASKDEKSEPALPPLSAHEFKQYNRLAEHMDYFHEHFRQSWNMLYQAASSGRRPAGMSLKQFIDEGLQFLSYLTTHHNIEERHIFPVLARKMPEFQAGGGKGKGKGGSGGGGKAAELLQQHKEIHKGMDAMEEYLRACRNGEADLEMAALRARMDTWGGVLWRHLEQEVETLGAENVRKYFSLEEIRRVPM